MYFSSENPFGNADTNPQLRANILENYHKEGKKLLLSAFGATEFPTS